MSKTSVKLTEREIEILTLINEGYSSGDVAIRLVVSKRTIDFHLQNVYTKLDVKNRIQAYNEAVKRELIK